MLQIQPLAHGVDMGHFTFHMRTCFQSTMQHPVSTIMPPIHYPLRYEVLALRAMIHRVKHADLGINVLLIEKDD